MTAFVKVDTGDEEPYLMEARAYRAIAAAAARGARFLDKHRPGWAGRIEVGELEMRSSCRCVYGQLESHQLLEEIDVARRGSEYKNGNSVDEQYGYVYPAAADEEDYMAAYTALQEEWLRQIVERLA